MIIAATERRMIDTASIAGPLFALDAVSGRLPHLVPVVPAPKVDGTAENAEEVADWVAGEEVLIGSEGADVELAIGVCDAWLDAAEADARIFGQKVSLQFWISEVTVSQSILETSIATLTLKV